MKGVGTKPRKERRARVAEGSRSSTGRGSGQHPETPFLPQEAGPLCGWRAAMGAALAAWRFSTREPGGQCVTISGTCRKQTLSAGSWAAVGPWRPQARPTLGKVPGRSSWTTCSAGGMKSTWTSAPTLAGLPTTAGTGRMLAWFVQVTLLPSRAEPSWALSRKSFPRDSVKKSQLRVKQDRNFPGSAVVKNAPSSVGNLGSIPGWGTKIPQAAEQLSLSTAIREPATKNQCSQNFEKRKESRMFFTDSRCFYLSHLQMLNTQWPCYQVGKAEFTCAVS